MIVYTCYSYLDDYCFDCNVGCRQDDPEHAGHKRLSVMQLEAEKAQQEDAPPDLGVSVSDEAKLDEGLE